MAISRVRYPTPGGDPQVQDATDIDQSHTTASQSRDQSRFASTPLVRSTQKQEVSKIELRGVTGLLSRTTKPLRSDSNRKNTGQVGNAASSLEQHAHVYTDLRASRTRHTSVERALGRNHITSKISEGSATIGPVGAASPSGKSWNGGVSGVTWFSEHHGSVTGACSPPDRGSHGVAGTCTPFDTTGSSGGSWHRHTHVSWSRHEFQRVTKIGRSRTARAQKHRDELHETMNSQSGTCFLCFITSWHLVNEASPGLDQNASRKLHFAVERWTLLVCVRISCPPVQTRAQTPLRDREQNSAVLQQVSQTITKWCTTTFGCLLGTATTMPTVLAKSKTFMHLNGFPAKPESTE